MITRPKQLATRRNALVAQAALQRARAADASAEIRRALGWAERGVALARRAARKPVMIGLAAAALAVLIAKPRQAATWLSYGLTAYTVLRRIRRAFATPAAECFPTSPGVSASSPPKEKRPLSRPPPGPSP